MKLEPPRLPRSWTVVGAVGALLGFTLWVLVACVAAHFIAKYW